MKDGKRFHLGYRFRKKSLGDKVLVAWISRRLALSLKSLTPEMDYYDWSAIVRYHDSDGFIRLLVYKKGCTKRR